MTTQQPHVTCVNKHLMYKPVLVAVADVKAATN